MSYCLNPSCPNPENLAHTELCQACGSPLLLQGRYRAIQVLGQGGFGATFLARDEELPGHPHCVIKQLRPAASSPNVLLMARELFKREAKTLGKIGNHPQVPRLLDYFEANQEFYLVQEYISGSTLQQEVRGSGPFSEAGVKQFLSEVLPMIQYIHSQQVIHRDIKPANLIRRTEDKKLVLIDFGAVKDKIDPVKAAASEQTALTSYAIGTPGYAPPEQMAMRPVYASDLYALGVTCVYLLAGKSPKDMDYDPATGEMLWRDYVHVSDHFASVLEKMLEVSVRHRFQSANDVLRALDLEPYMDSLAQSMVTANRPPRSPKSGMGRTIGNSNEMSTSSPTSRIAAAIRARQSRNASDATSLQPGASRHQLLRKPSSSSSDTATGSTSSSRGGSAKVMPRLTAEELLEAYSKGRRDFTSHNLGGLSLQKADLSGASFHQSKLQKTNCQNANLFNADFGRANLNQAVLKNANLARAYLSHADLGGANLRGADLSYAYLSNANLRGANLCGADLTGAKVSDDQLATARTNWATIHPSGKRGFW
ncbi:MAG: pentapeptide repeat-containing protein [Synechococcales cyanobacterium K44_A2020_017]|uniref:serine/threonine-protein kinase n=1 Tax=Leptolyngbya sp. CCY15150 TaxID=2767772 RepID=UPI00195244B7|nr:serine/threonine-protein kinase [Leptolyngbya sp. CCY15150]MBF2087609.1 pentapeptide repeat-containing protein [Synechococcales cyanobacterium K32_A2020_035]MBF2096230.1 pentapeptide repeat-containing protein [Synechococcales cyanobacterium K44_A2020_017]